MRYEVTAHPAAGGCHATTTVALLTITVNALGASGSIQQSFWTRAVLDWGFASRLGKALEDDRICLFAGSDRAAAGKLVRAIIQHVIVSAMARIA